ncbi:MAG TPA: BTAD domain-containing putative transcriptional regulator [Afifellaceae bacterium]|nr:BTAD domain-containing putative transcriptional regulator [Afifellaceae bacterium]
MPVNLFGAFAIEASDGEAMNLPTRKTAQVLAMLALLGEKGAVRDTLAEWVWPDRSEGQAKSSLRQALTAIRKILPQILEDFELKADQNMVRLIGPDALIDVRQFDGIAASDNAADQARAANLYRSDLLEGVPFPPQLDNQVAARREQYRNQALALVEAMSENPDRPGSDLVACEALANRLLQTDPAAEAAHRALIRIRLAQGQPNSARRQLERCEEALARELGVEPEAKTTGLLTDDPAELPAGDRGAQAPESKTDGPSGQSLSAGEPRMIPSVVVMPFDDLGSQQGDFFADGVVEEITTALSRIKDFFVIARQSAYTYKGRFVDAREVGRDLGVRYAVEGTVRRGGERVRITVQLIETESGTQLWSDRYEDIMTDIFDLQDRIASHVAGAINPSIRASEIELAKRTRPENMQAYDFVLRAFPHFWVHRKEDNEIALDLFAEALKRDPEYGVALAFKAWCHAQQACYLWADDPGEERALAIATAEQAAQQVGDNATALTAIGATYSLSTIDYELAESFITRSLAIDPNNAWGWMRSGWLKVLFHRDDVEAEQCFERALALSPFDPFRFNVLLGMSVVHQQRGDLEMAVKLTKEGLRAGSGMTWAYRMLATYYARLGDEENAADALARLIHHYPGLTMEKLRKGIPPSFLEYQPAYFEGLRKAGIPES